jgi:polyhydroxybutyrate depolymerase
MGVTETHYISFGGFNRSYNLFLPREYVKYKNRRKFNLPLLVGYHGGGSNMVALQAQSQMNVIADENTFAVAYVNGTAINPLNLTFNADFCCGYAAMFNVDDVGFTNALIAQVKGLLPINSKAIFGFGFSNGALLCYKVAIDSPGTFRAIAPVAGGLSSNYSKTPSKVPVLHIHGRQDSHIPVDGGVGTDAIVPVNFMSISQVCSYWTQSNTNTGSYSEKTDNYEYRSLFGDYNTYSYYIVENNGHQFPGGVAGQDPSLGALNPNFKANQILWNFFKGFIS